MTQPPFRWSCTGRRWRGASARRCRSGRCCRTGLPRSRRAWPWDSCRRRRAWRRRSRACRSRTAGRRAWTKAAGTARACRRRSSALGRLDLLALGFQGQHGAGVDGLAVEHDGAGAAGAAIADALAAGDVEVVAQGVEQRDARLDGGGHFGAVDVEGDLDRRGADGRHVGPWPRAPRPVRSPAAAPGPWRRRRRRSRAGSRAARRRTGAGCGCVGRSSLLALPL